VERRVVATCLIWPGEEHLPEEVARPVGNAGSNLLLNVTVFLVVNKTAPNVHRKAIL
jgi:hypothetical protein